MGKRKDQPDGSRFEGICAKYHLTVRDRAALATLIRGGTQKEAARAAGRSPGSVGARVRRPGSFRAALLEMMDHVGLGEKKLLGAVQEGVVANKPIWHPAKKDFFEYPDHFMRLKAAEIGLQLKGAFPERNGSGGVVAVQIVTNIDGGGGGEEGGAYETPFGFEGEMKVREEDGSAGEDITD